MAARLGGPLGVVPQEFDVELVEAAGGADIDGIVLDLLDRGDSRQREEEAEVRGKIAVGRGDCFAGDQFLGLQRLAVGGKNELRLCLDDSG